MNQSYRTRRWAAVGGVLLSGLLLSASPLVVAATGDNAKSGHAIEEVVVTAQRAEQSLQDVPVAVSAFTGAMMEDKQIVSPSDLQINAPNVSFTDTNFGGSSFSIRGIGRLVISASGESGVSIHQNQIPVPTNLPAAEFYDMERVEVLRGPQGTLFGRNATGGVINMVTKMPTFDAWDGYLEGEGGGYNDRKGKAGINIPITSNFALRVAGIYLKRDGYIRNTADNQVGNCLIAGTTQTQPCTLKGINKDVDGRDLYSYRVTALYQITDNAKAWVQYNRFYEHDDKVRITNQVCKRSVIPVIGCEPNGFGFDTPNAGTTTGGIFGGLDGAVLLGDPSPTSAFPVTHTGFRKMHTDYEPIYHYRENLWTGEFSYDLSKYTISVDGAYQDSQYVTRQDYNMDVGFNLYANALNPSGLWPTSEPAGPVTADWTSADCNFNDGTSGIFGGCTLPVDQTRVFAYDQSDSQNRYWTAEAKIQSSLDGFFNFIVGTNYLRNESSGDYYVSANTLDLVGNYGVPLLGFPPLYPTMFDATGAPNGNGNVTKSYSVFGETYFQLTPTVKLTAGLRWNDDKKKVEDTSVLYNAVNVNALTGGALGPNPVWTRTTGFLFGDNTDVALGNLYAPDLVQAALATPALSPERFAVSAAVPLAPGFGEQRILTGSPDTAEWKELTGRIGVDVTLSDDSMMYVFYTRGYKPGGFNPPLNSSFVNSGTAAYTFNPEHVDSLEVGSKNTLLDGTLVLNGALFVYDYRGLQVTRIANNTSINDNINAIIKGAELESFWQPDFLPGLAMDVAYSWLNAKVAGSRSVDPINRTAGDPNYITLENIDPGSLTGVNYVARIDQITPTVVQNAYAACGALSQQNPNTACPQVAPDANAVYQTNPATGQPLANGIPSYFSRSFLSNAGVETSDGLPSSLDGKSLPNSPVHTVHVGLAYTWPIDFIAGSLTARWDYYWQSDSYAREFNTPGDKIDSWDQHNASLIYESNDGHWLAKAWVRNLQNEDNVTGKYLTSDTSGFYRNYFLTDPRLYGVSVRYSFQRAR